MVYFLPSPLLSGRRIRELTISCRVSCIGACITNVDDQILQKALQTLIKVRQIIDVSPIILPLCLAG